MKILVAINNLTVLKQPVYANHCQLWYRLGRDCSEHTFGLCNPSRMSIDRMRNFSARAVLENDFDYLLFLDDDVLVPFDAISRLVKADKDIVAGVTLIRGYPYHPMIFNFVGPQISSDSKSHFVDDYAERADPETGLLECDAVGFSLCLIKASVLRSLQPPYFLTFDGQCTEDVYFCNKAKLERPGTEVWVDTKIHTAHILGDEMIEPDNLIARRAYDEFLEPGRAERTRLAESKSPVINPKNIKKVDYSQYIKQVVFG